MADPYKWKEWKQRGSIPPKVGFPFSMKSKLQARLDWLAHDTEHFTI